MKNFPFKHNGKEYWYSRSMASATMVVFERDSHIYLLSVKRGKGAETHVGDWGLPGGYLDFDETLYEAGIRETFEETGVDISDKNYTSFLVIDSPRHSKLQTVTFVFFVKVEKEFCTSTNNSEPDEIEKIKWIDIDTIYEYNWMYNDNLLKNLYKYAKSQFN